jgi:nucleoside-diphosphate-sugar epimerase
MNVLVTGASGFIGRALCRTLMERGYSVRAALRGAGASPTASECVRVGDLGEPMDWYPALRNIDAVVHLAARVHVMREQAKDPLNEFRRVNVAGTRRLLEMAADSGVRRFVYVSSIKVNGERTNGRPFDALDLPRPEDYYGQSKLEAEQAVKELAPASGIEWAIVRPPLVYGPGVGGNFRRLLQLVDSGLPLPLKFEANRRSLISVSNLADLLVLACYHPRAAGQVLLVSDGEDLSTAELIRRLAHAHGRSARFLPIPAALMERVGKTLGFSKQLGRLSDSLQVDSRAVRQLLDWYPPLTVDQALQQTAAEQPT